VSASSIPFLKETEGQSALGWTETGCEPRRAPKEPRDRVKNEKFLRKMDFYRNQIVRNLPKVHGKVYVPQTIHVRIFGAWYNNIMLPVTRRSLHSCLSFSRSIACQIAYSFTLYKKITLIKLHIYRISVFAYISGLCINYCQCSSHLGISLGRDIGVNDDSKLKLTKVRWLLMA
jgi:hypothetical protein